MKRAASWAVAATGLLLLLLAGALHPRLLAQRSNFHVVHVDPLQNTPPLVAFTTVALGGFRGILTDLLWLRVARLQEQGEFFEIVQLSDWITKLEPRFPAVWGFHAWNMAYNISVLLTTPEERWRWVRHGIGLLRDQGLYYNPAEAALYWELGWLFQHKVGAHFDSAHPYYQREWALEMTRLFGGGRPAYETFDTIPSTKQELLADAPAADLVGELDHAGRDPLDPSLLDAAPGSDTHRLLRSHPGGKRLTSYLRLKRIREEYKLEPTVMREMDTTLGPLDWRLPETHAIYWAWRGRPFATGFNSVSLDRMVYQSMARLLETGALAFEPESGRYERSPNLDLFDRADEAYQRAMTAHPEQETIAVAHRNFLVQAAKLFRAGGRPGQAAALEARLEAEYAGFSSNAE